MNHAKCPSDGGSAKEHARLGRINMKARILIVDGGPTAGQDAIVALGGARSGENYAQALASQAPCGPGSLDCFILAAAEGERLPQGMQLTDFQGIAWTGSPMSAYEQTAIVKSQIDLAREAFQTGVPCFGSCWGLQVMSVALGGRVHLNPNGYEFGFARQIRVNDDGRLHPMFDGKAHTFDAVCVHQDEVCALPPGGRLLASNDVSKVQAVEYVDGDRSFWGVQYHPEFDLSQISALLHRRSSRLVNDGFAQSEAVIEAFAAELMDLAHDKARKDIAWRYAIGADITDPLIHRREFSNWLSTKVMPRVG
jgi:GMP synthase (glutamine-hydrolysing)